MGKEVECEYSQVKFKNSTSTMHTLFCIDGVDAEKDLVLISYMDVFLLCNIERTQHCKPNSRRHKNVFLILPDAREHNKTSMLKIHHQLRGAKISSSLFSCVTQHMGKD